MYVRKIKVNEINVEICHAHVCEDSTLLDINNS